MESNVIGNMLGFEPGNWGFESLLSNYKGGDMVKIGRVQEDMKAGQLVVMEHGGWVRPVDPAPGYRCPHCNYYKMFLLVKKYGERTFRHHICGRCGVKYPLL